MYLKTNKSSTLISYVVDDGSTEKLLELGWQNLLGEPKPTAVFCINSTKWWDQKLSSSSPETSEPEPDIFMLVSDGSVHKMTYEEHHQKIQEIDELRWYSTEIVSKPDDWELIYDFEIQNLKEILDKIKLEKSPYYFGTVAYTTDKDSIITTTRGKRGDGFCEIIRVDHRQRKIYATEKATLNAPFLEMLSYEFALYGGKVILHGHEQLEDAETLPYIFDGTTQCFNIIDYIRTNKLKTFNIKNHGYYKLFSSFDDAKTWLNNIKTINQTIANFEESLIEYKKELEKSPDSTFYIGLVKNTEEYIEELKVELNKRLNG